MEAVFQLRVDTVTVVKEVSHTEMQSGKEERALSISQIETVDKKTNNEFPDKIFFFLGWLGGEERVVLPMKAFIGSILKYWSFLHYPIWLLQSNFSRQEKEDNFHLRFATFWSIYVCVFACLWLCLTENFLLNWLGQTTTPETTFPTLFEKIIVAMAENCEWANCLQCLLSCDWRWLVIYGHMCSEQWICRGTS